MALRHWSTTASGNASVAGINWQEGQAPSTINNSAREEMSQVRDQYTAAQWHWVEVSNTASVASQTGFKLSTDLTADFHPSRRVRLTGGSSTRYGSVVSSSYTAETMVTITVDGGSLSASHTIAALGPAVTNTPIGGVALLSQTATFTAPVVMSAGLGVSATASFAGAVTMASSLGVSATASFGGTMAVAGTVTMASALNVSATASFGHITAAMVTLNGGGGTALRMANIDSVSAKDTGGTYRNVLIGRFNDNVLYLDGGAAGFAIRTNNGATQAIQGDSAGELNFPNVSTTAAPANAFLESGTGNTLKRSTSSLRYKHDIRVLDPSAAIALLRQLRPIRYRSLAKADDPSTLWYGFLAEDVASVEPSLVHWGYADEDMETVETARAESDVAVLDELGKPFRDDDGNAVARKVIQVAHDRRPKAGAAKVPDGMQYERLTVIHTSVLAQILDRLEALEAIALNVS